MRAPGFLELADHELIGAGRGLPVDVAPIVTRDIVAQSMERNIRTGQFRGGHALKVTDKTCRRAAKRYRPGVNEQVHRIGPHHATAQQVKGVSTHRTDRAHHNHCTPRGGNGEKILMNLRRLHPWQMENGGI
ncbi:hypothetical protein D3C73_1416550 [compost metagenome]